MPAWRDVPGIFHREETKDYVTRLAWESRGVLADELEEVTGDSQVRVSLLGQLRTLFSSY